MVLFFFFLKMKHFFLEKKKKEQKEYMNLSFQVQPTETIKDEVDDVFS